MPAQRWTGGHGTDRNDGMRTKAMPMMRRRVPKTTRLMTAERLRCRMSASSRRWGATISAHAALGRSTRSAAENDAQDAQVEARGHRRSGASQGLRAQEWIA